MQQGEACIADAFSMVEMADGVNLSVQSQRLSTHTVRTHLVLDVSSLGMLACMKLLSHDAVLLGRKQGRREGRQEGGKEELLLTTCARTTSYPGKTSYERYVIGDILITYQGHPTAK